MQSHVNSVNRTIIVLLLTPLVFGFLFILAYETWEDKNSSYQQAKNLYLAITTLSSPQISGGVKWHKPKTIRGTLKTIDNYPNFLMAYVYNKNMQPLVNYGNTSIEEQHLKKILREMQARLIQSYNAEEVNATSYYENNVYYTLGTVISRKQVIGYIFLQWNMEDINQLLLYRSLENASILFCISLMVILLLYFLIRRKIILPIHEISTAVKNYHIEQPQLVFSQRLSENKSEIGELAAAFKNMAEYIRLARKELVSEKNHAVGLAAFPINNPNPVIKLSLAGEIILANSAASTMFPDLHRLAAKHPFLTGLLAESFIENTVMREIDINDRIFLQAIVSIKVGTEKQLIIYASDITPIKEAQLAAEAMSRAKSSFVANISHELRTPLHAIINHVRFTRRAVERAENGKIYSHLETIQKSSKRLLALINEVLELSKLETDKSFLSLEDQDFNNLVNNAVEELSSLSENKHIVINVHSLQTDNIIAINKNKIEQVIVNILSNAIKFTPKEGHITIELSKKIQSLSGHKEQEFLQCSIQDSGPGILEKDLEKIFDAFYQCENNYHSGGTGLGLSICREIILAHQGKVWAEKTPQGGLCIIFILPYSQ